MRHMLRTHTPHGRREVNYGTLWTDIDVGAGTRAWDSSGSVYRGPHAGAHTTFWCDATTRGALRRHSPVDNNRDPS